MTTFTKHPDYDKLPDSIKEYHSEEEYAWMSEEQKLRLIDDECMPDPETED